MIDGGRVLTELTMGPCSGKLATVAARLSAALGLKLAIDRG